MSASAASGGPHARTQDEVVTSLGTLITSLIDGPVDRDTLRRALTHRSYAYENGGLPNNERLEFLGDAVLGLVITDTLHADYPDLPEGQLAKLRASLVNMRALADVARGIGLGDHLLLGRGEETTGGRDKASILADTFEAVIGTVFRTGGLPAAERFIHALFDDLIAHSVDRGAGLDWKTSLQELASSLGVAPEYRVSEAGPDHAKEFTATVVVDGQVLGVGTGRSKKEAEQHAAEQAWQALQARTQEPTVAGVNGSAPQADALADGEAAGSDAPG